MYGIARARTRGPGPGDRRAEGLLEGAERGARDPARVGRGELDALVGLHQRRGRARPARRRARHGPGPDSGPRARDRPARVPDQVDERQRALALVEVAVDLLAVLLLGADQVEQVVLDLERRAEVEAEAHERPQVLHAADQRPGAQRVHGRVPARLVHDQVEVVLGLERGDAVVAPAELGGLALERAQGHRVELRQHAVAEVLAELPRRGRAARGWPARPARRPRSGPAPARTRATSVGRPRRRSEPSTMSSWIRKALWSSSIATATGSTSPSSPPKARLVATHSAGRMPLPGRLG